MKKTKVIMVIMAVCLMTGCLPKKYLEDGVALLEEKKYEEAVEMFQKEADREKNLGEAYRGMGMAYYEMKEYKKALQMFEEALVCEAEETGTIYNFIALCDMELGKYENALSAFDKGISMEDTSEELKQEMEFNKIVVYEKIEAWEHAKKAVNEYVSEYPDDADAAKEAEFLETR